MVKLQFETSKIVAIETGDNVRDGRTYVFYKTKPKIRCNIKIMGILFFQKLGGAGVRIPLGGRVPPLLLYPLDRVPN